MSGVRQRIISSCCLTIDNQFSRICCFSKTNICFVRWYQAKKCKKWKKGWSIRHWRELDSPWLDSPTFLRHRPAWPVPAQPGTLSARTSSPAHRSDDRRTWVGCASSCHLCLYTFGWLSSKHGFDNNLIARSESVYQLLPDVPSTALGSGPSKASTGVGQRGLRVGLTFDSSR